MLGQKIQFRCASLVPIQKCYPSTSRTSLVRRTTLQPPKATFFDLAWQPNTTADTIAPQIFASSIIPYAGFLYHLTRSKDVPKLTLFGFYFLLVFVGVSIPAGIIAKTQYGTSLSNVDFLHGGAEIFLTITNLLLVIGLRQGILEKQAEKAAQLESSGSGSDSGSISESNPSSISSSSSSSESTVKKER